MKKIDLEKELSQLYKVKLNKIEIVDVPELKYIMVDGHGDPNHSAQFQEAIEALYSVSYTIKFMYKKGPEQIDYGVMPLEGLWWSNDMNQFSMGDQSAWKWTLMIMQPEFVTVDMFEKAKADAAERKELPLIYELRMETMHEGLSAQLLHIGPYDTEGPDIMKLHQFILDEGYQLRGKHREIYLSDMRRTAPDKLKTIIRQPMGK